MSKYVKPCRLCHNLTAVKIQITNYPKQKHSKFDYICCECQNWIYTYFMNITELLRKLKVTRSEWQWIGCE